MSHPVERRSWVNRMEGDRMKVDAMVLSGKLRTRESFQEVSPEECEATIPVGGKPPH